MLFPLEAWLVYKLLFLYDPVLLNLLCYMISLMKSMEIESYLWPAQVETLNSKLPLKL